MKKILIIFLALVMCLSVFVSCNNDKGNNNENNNNDEKKDVAKEMETVTDAIGKLDLKDLINSTIDEIFAQGTQSDLNELLAEFKKLNAEANISATVDGEKSNVYIGIKDEVIKITDPFDKDGFAFLSGNSFVLIYPEDNGYRVEVSDELPVAGMMPDMSESINLDQYKQMIEMYLTDDVMAALEGIKLDVTKADLVEKDGFYILTNDAIVRIANEVFDAYVDVMKALGAPAEALPPVDEVKAQIKAIVEGLNLQIGFSVKNDKVVGIKFATEFDPDAIGFIGSGEKVESEVMPVADISPKVAISLVAMSNDDATLPASVDMSYSFEEDGEKQAFNYKVNFLYNDKAALCGADVSFTIEMGNSYLGSYDEDTKDESYSIRGTQKITGSVKLDLSKLATAGATVADVNITMSAKAETYINEYYDEANGWVEQVITDTATINKIEAANCYVKSGSVTANAKVEKAGILAFNVAVKNSINTTVSGNLTWTAAPNYGTIPANIRDNFINNESLIEKINNIKAYARNLSGTHTDIFATLAPYASLTWYDEASGLWARVRAYDLSDVELFTVQPEADMVINAK